MRLNLQLLTSWLLYVTATVVLILLWLNKFDVQRETINESVHDATVLIRVANFILTSEILLLVSTFYGGFIWFFIRRNSIKTKHADRWFFYDGGSTLYPTVKAFITSDMVSFKVASMFVLTIMIGAYFLDIFYINSITYSPVEQCEVRNTTEIDIMSSSQAKLANLDRFTTIYAIGSRVGLLPYNNIPYTTNIYQVPAVGNTTFLQNYTTIAYDISVQCKNAAMRITNSSVSSELSVDAQGYNNTFTEMEGINMNDNGIAIIGEFAYGFVTGEPPYTFFMSSATRTTGGGVQQQSSNRKYVDLTPIQFGNNSVISVYCASNVTYKLINDVYGSKVNLDEDTSVNNFAYEAMKLPVLAYDAYSSTDGFLEWLINGKEDESGTSNNNNHQLISVSDIEKRITVAMIEFLKGGGINGTTTTSGYYCFSHAYRTSIASWYTIVFTSVQIVAIFLLIIYTVITSQSDLVMNDVETLLKYSDNSKIICNNIEEE